MSTIHQGFQISDAFLSLRMCSAARANSPGWRHPLILLTILSMFVSGAVQHAVAGPIYESARAIQLSAAQGSKTQSRNHSDALNTWGWFLIGIGTSLTSVSVVVEHQTVEDCKNEVPGAHCRWYRFATVAPVAGLTAAAVGGTLLIVSAFRFSSHTVVLHGSAIHTTIRF